LSYRASLLLCLACTLPVLAQDPAANTTKDSNGVARPRRVYQATRLQGSAPRIDGKLDDTCWTNLGEWAGDYTQREPHEGGTPTHPTRIKLLYDNHYLYVAMHADQPGVGLQPRPLGNRDEFAGDMMGITLDSFHTLRNAYEFDIGAGGSKIDLVLHNDGSIDQSWNAVWDARSTVSTDSWDAEFRIPLSQLRYNSGPGQVWGMHAWRWLNQKQEESNWNLLPMGNQGLVYSFGELRGLDDIPPSRRLELLPYAVAKLTSNRPDPGNPFTNGRKTATDFGLDAKYGLGTDLTLDLTINPDFGQVEADPSEINLSTVETFLKERRPFFLEGKEIFDLKYDDDLPFYTRRIGDAPALTPRTAGFADRPENTRILGSAKLTGRTQQGLSLGLLHATTDRMETRVLASDGFHTELAEPFTNADILRLQQDLNNGDTLLGALFTSNLRTGSDAELRTLSRQAFTGGLDALHYWGNRDWFAEARILATSVRGSREAIANLQENPVHNFQRPDADHIEVDPDARTLGGNAGYVRAGRANGSKWRYNLFNSWRSPGVEFNDLGYLQSADQRVYGARLTYFSTETTRMLRRRELFLQASQTRNYGGEILERKVMLNAEAATMSGTYVWARLTRVNAGLDTRYLRGGPAIRTAGWDSFNCYAEAPGSMTLQPKFDGATSLGHTHGSTYYRVAPGLVARVSDRFKAELNIAYENNRAPNEFGGISTRGLQKDYLVASMHQQTLAPTLRLNMNFNPDLSLSYYGGPFISSGRYEDYRVVSAPRELGDRRFAPVSLDRNGSLMTGTYLSQPLQIDRPDFDWRELKSNLVLRWEYRAGSTLHCVWSQYRSDWEDVGGFSPTTQTRRLFASPADNTFLIKLSYWFSI